MHHKFLIPGHTHLECDVDHAVIERAKKRCKFAINHPRDWYQLVRTAGNKNTFEVQVMNMESFYDFAELLKGPLIWEKTTAIIKCLYGAQ